MTEQAPIHIVELCRRISRLHEAEERRWQEMSDSELAAMLENDDDTQKGDFLNAVISKLSELTGLRRQDVAEFIHRSAHGGNWEEWKRRNGETWPDISVPAQKMLDAHDRGHTTTFLTWLATHFPNEVQAMGLDVHCSSPTEPVDYITLDQAAALIGVSKRTLERHLADEKLPQPDAPGGAGHAHKWAWPTIRPALESLSRRPLPERWPGSRIL